LGGIETVLVSVWDKTGLDEFARRLKRLGMKLIASGGTGRYLSDSGVDFQDISEITGKVEFLGGLVKTLHPAIHAGLLADRRDPDHMKELLELCYRKIDMVVVNFYPLEGPKGKRDLSFIDIGGPAMARAAAKNFVSCVPVTHPSWYERILEELESGGEISADLRWQLARDAILRTGSYDAETLSVMPDEAGVGSEVDSILLSMKKAAELRYGENPHQRGRSLTTTYWISIAVSIRSRISRAKPRWSLSMWALAASPRMMSRSMH
jgi:phosphoribosylaminoimidazolecarboxamide formyltransferase/IMP cyclohydrolase